MAIGTRTDPKLRAEIVDKIRNHGMSVSEAADAYRPSTTSCAAMWWIATKTSS